MTRSGTGSVLFRFGGGSQKRTRTLKLPEKLLAEAEGVLAWAVKGARQWYENSLKRVGLGKPSEVEKAPKEWRVESDPVGPFIADRCTKEDDLRVQASKALAGSHDDTVLALAIAWQGVAGHARRKIATDFFQSVMAVNVSLSGNSHRDTRDERTPSDFPEGGSRSVTTGNPFNPSRWSH